MSHPARPNGATAERMPAPQLPFADRQAAGRELAGRLRRWAGEPNLLVLGLPRGGVPVAYEVAGALGAPLDVFLVRKLGVPGHQELAMGAVASGGVRVLNEQVLRDFGVSQARVEAVTERAMEDIRAREMVYRDGAPPLPVAGRTAVLVDDGLATGASMRAAVAALRAAGPARVVVAVPVAPADTCARLRREVDDVICAATPEPFAAVGLWYRDFTPVATEEVRRLLHEARRARP